MPLILTFFNTRDLYYRCAHTIKLIVTWPFYRSCDQAKITKWIER